MNSVSSEIDESPKSTCKRKIMIVDDIEDNLKLMEFILDPDYQIITASSGEESIEKVQTEKPELILLDVRMPGMDGYEVCKTIKSNPQSAFIPVIFVSAGNSLEDKIKGYEVGAEDYVDKPFQDEELLAKINKSLKNKDLHERLRIENSSAKQTAFAAMNSASELGIVIRFMHDSSDCKNYDELAKRLFNSLELFSLNCCIQIHTHTNIINFNCNDTSLESQILTQFRERDKIFDFKARTIVNEEYISLLVKNMPVDDNEKYGRTKDNISVLLSGANIRLKSLILEHELQERREGGIEEALQHAKTEVVVVNDKFTNHQKSSRQIIMDLRSDIEALLMSLGLTEEQERVLLERIDDSLDELDDLNHVGDEIDARLCRIIDSLNSLSMNNYN